MSKNCPNYPDGIFILLSSRQIKWLALCVCAGLMITVITWLAFPSGRSNRQWLLGDWLSTVSNSSLVWHVQHLQLFAFFRYTHYQQMHIYLYIATVECSAYLHLSPLLPICDKTALHFPSSFVAKKRVQEVWKAGK